MKRFSQIFKIGLAMFLAVFSTNLLPIATAYADSTTPGPNQEVYWQTLPGEVCSKKDEVNTLTYVVPAVSADYDWSKAIVKAGDESANGGLAVHQEFSPIVTGQVLSHETRKDISHIILCSVPASVAVPSAPASTDPCNPIDVINNVAWETVLPASTATVLWTQSVDGKTRTATLANSTLKWSDNTTAPKTFTLPTDSGELCDTDKGETPVAPTANPIATCGAYGSLIFAKTEGVIYTLTSGDGKQGAYTVTATAAEGYVLKKNTLAVFTGDLGVYTACPQYYLDTSHETNVCGQATISLRNVSPWMYRVLIETKVGDAWVRVEADTGNQWMVVPGVMMVDNRGEAPDDQTGIYTIKFAEDSGSHIVRYKVSSGAEQDLYVGLPVGQWTEFTVDSDCKPPVEDKKVFVCKFVGTPGIDEVLKEGKNPISVSVNAAELEPWDGTIGGEFSDAQGRSFVLGWDDGESTYDREDCLREDPEPIVVTPVAPTFLEASCAVLNGRVVLTAKTGVHYTINDERKEAGTYSYPASSTVTVVAHAEEGSTFDLEDADTITWVHTFAAVPLNCILGDTDVCPNILGSQPTVPVGYVKDLLGNCVQPTSGNILSTSTQATELPATIPATGPVEVANPIFAILAAITAYGATFFYQQRRNLRSEVILK